MDVSAQISPPEWAAAIATIARGEARRVMVIGPTDVGKSSFIRAAMAAAAPLVPRIRLIDLDPGQKMLGPPGTVGSGDGLSPERLIFVGSTSAGEMAKITSAAAALVEDARAGFIANTAGFVRGPGTRLQSWTIASLRPDLIVAIGDPAVLAPILTASSGIAIARLPASPFARRKSASQRAALRQAAFEEAIAGAVPFLLDSPAFTPAPPRPFEGSARPVCAIADGRGDVLSMGIQLDSERLLARRPPVSAKVIQLGKIWAEPKGEGWRLIERLQPAWAVEG